MVAIVAGNGLGLERGSAKLLGAQGQLGSAFLGRNNEMVSVNSATGNLVIQNTDEVLVGRGPDAIFNRTYNSLGNYTNLDGSADADEWLSGAQRKIVLSGTGNTAGSTATLTDWDGSVVVFAYDATSGTYKSTENPYRDDTLTWSSNVFTWTEGQSRLVQTFASNIGGRLTSAADADGNTITYTYDLNTTAGKLTRVTTANSTGSQYNYTDLGYTNGNLTSLVTSYYDTVTSTNKTLTRTTYTYDAGNRLATVTTDLTPANTGDSSTYVTTYGYKDASSKLVTSIAQSDGTNFVIAYDGSNRVSSVTQTASSGVTRQTTFSYDTVNRVTTITDPLSNVYKMTYDASNRLAKVEEPAPTGGNPSIRTFEYNATGDVTRVLTFDNAANVGTPSLAIEYRVNNYDTLGNLIESVDGANQSVAYTYGSLNEVLTETHYTGFDANGLADGAAPTGAMTIHYVYDAAGNGVADDGSATGDDAAEKHLRFRISAEGRVTEYRYNALGQLIAQIDYAGTLYTGSTWTEAGLASWVSGTADKTQEQRTDYTYDFRGNLATAKSFSVTDSTGAGSTGQDWSQITYVYDQFGKLLSKLLSGTNSLGGEAAGVTETFVYDGLGRVISSSDLYGQTTTITYTDSSRTTVISTPNDVTHTLTYNIAGELLSEGVSGSGITTGTTSYAYDNLGRLRVQTDALGVKTYFTYDKQNRLTAKIDGDGSMTEFKYDGADRIVATVSYTNAVSSANLTTLANASTNTEVATIRPTAAAADRWAWRIYNKAGQVIETIDALGAVAIIAYDGAGRVTATKRYYNLLSSTTINGSDGISGYRTSPPAAQVLPTADATNDRPTRNFYDNDGLLIGALDEDGYLSEVIYDKAGRKTETVRYTNVTSSSYWASGTFAQLKGSITLAASTDIHNYWLYDGRGRVGAVIDGEGNVTRYHYTARGDVDQEIRGQKVTASTSYTLASLPAASGTLETTRFYHNAAGQVTQRVRTLSSGTETTDYTYDTRGRLVTQKTSESISSETRTQRFRYDVKGRLIGQLDGVGAATLGASPTDAQIDTAILTYGTRYVYDTGDRLIQKIEPDGTGSTGVKTLYYYDTDGQLRFQINALGEVSEYRYNVLEDRSDVYVYGTRISAGTLATLTGGLVDTTVTNAVAAITNASLDSHTRYAYDNRGQVSRIYDPLYDAQQTSDHYSDFGYNAFGQLVSQNAPTGGVEPRNVTLTTYNRRGLKTSDYRYLNYSTLSAIGALMHSYVYDGFARLVSQADNNTTGASHGWTYDRAGRLVQQTDNLGNATSYVYDARSNLVSSTDANGKTTSFAYDLFNRNVTTTTPEGVQTSVTKNAYGQTITVTIPGSFFPADNLARTTSYTYDKNGNLKTVTDAAGTTTNTYDHADHLTDTTDALGVVTHYTYDAADRVLTRVEDYGSGKLNLTTTYAYDAKGEVTSVTDPLGVVTTYAYDLKGQKVSIVQDAGSGKLNITTNLTYRADGKVATQVDAAGTSAQRTTSYTYDSMGRLTQRVEDSGSGKLNVTTSYIYDVNGNVVQVKDALNRLTQFVYDKDNRLVLTIDAEGEITQNGYDNDGRVIWTRSFTNVLSAAQLATLPSSMPGNQWLEATAAGNGDVTVTLKTKDMSTLVVTSTTIATVAAAASDRISRTLYDGDGRVAYTVDAEGFVTGNVYDGAGKVTKTRRYAAAIPMDNTATKTWLDGQVPAGEPASAVITSYKYDAAGRVTDVTDAAGVVTHFVLDAGGRITDTHVAYGTSDVSVTHRVFDNVGRVISETRAYGQPYAAATSYAYDALSRVTGTTNPNGYTTTYTYDNLGRLLSQTVPLDGSTSATTSYQYDARGNRVKVTDPRSKVTWLYYDGVDRLITELNPEGYVTATTYAIGNNVASVKRYANQASNLGSVSATVPPTVTADATRDATTTYTYDKIDRVKTVADAEGGTTSYSYDALSNRTAMTNEVGGTTTYTYDKTGRTTSYTETTGTANYTESYVYDGFGNQIQVTNKLGGVTTYTFDKAGRLTTETKNITAYDNTGAQVLTQVVTTYSYDNRGNLTTKVEGANATGTLAANKQTTAYTYDKLDRLTDRIDPAFMGYSPVTHYQYDSAGDVILQTAADGGQSFAYYDRNNRKIEEISPVGTLTTWTYDASGNVISQKVYATSVSLPGSAGGTPPAPIGSYRETQFAYDGNNRVTQTVIVGVRTGAFNGSSYVTTDNQNLTSTNQYDFAGNLIKEASAAGGAIFHYYDRNGRETAKVDQEGYITRWTRRADGNVTSETRFATRFTGTPTAGGTAPTVGADATNDRTTTFTYDTLGRRLTETRTAVLASTISGNSVTTSSQSSAVTYTYNGLGEVVSKTEATGDKLEYQYDTQGRLERQLDPVALDFNSSGAATLRHVTYFYYDGLNNLVRTVEKAEVSSAVGGAPGTTGTYASGYSSTDDRVNSFTYDGRVLTAVTDAAGGQHNYSYDIAGRRTNDYYTRAKSDASTVVEGNLVTYDAAGRVTSQYQASGGPGSWTTQGPATTFTYDAFGEVTARAVGGLMEESFTYDNAGHVVKTTSGDGVQKFLVYDANGNATLVLQSNGRDMSADTVNSLLGYVGAIDTMSVTDVVATITVYDKRNMMTATREPNRQIANSGNLATTVNQTLVRTRTYNAFGEAASETDARGYTTNYTYNTMGRMLRAEAPGVRVVDETGTANWVRPSTDNYYDLSGRLVATRDANGSYAAGTQGAPASKAANTGNLTTRQLLAGTGYGGSDALVVKEFRPDSSVWETRYDAFGNARQLIDGIGRVTAQAFDKDGRLTQVTRPGGLVDSYAYDVLGQRILHWDTFHTSTTNSGVGSPVWVTSGYMAGGGPYVPPTWVDTSHWEYPAPEKTDYDIAGRVEKTVNFAGDTDTYAYSWSSTPANAALSITGGWTKSSSFSTGKTATDVTDYFGHLLSHTDLGGHVYTMTYNRAGQLSGQTSSAGQNLTYTYYNTGNLAQMIDGAPLASGYSNAHFTDTYTYDEEGNRTYEYVVGTMLTMNPYRNTSTTGAKTLQESSATYDGLGRLLQLTDPGTSGNGAASIQNDYDANGNVRHTLATHFTFNSDQTLSSTTTTDDYWYKYDSLNRMTTVKGSLVNGQIVRGTGVGRDIAYDLAGERVSQTQTVLVPGYYQEYVGYIPDSYYESRETYTYTSDGLLANVYITQGSTTTDPSTVPSAPAPSSSNLRAQNSYDAIGRVTDYKEFAADGTTVNYNRYAITYDARNQVLSESSTLQRYENGYLYVNYSTTTNTYASGGGPVSQVSTSNYAMKNGNTYESRPSTQTNYTYGWWDTAQQTGITYQPDMSSGTIYTTANSYDVNGHLAMSYINDGGGRRGVHFLNDADGQIRERQVIKTSLFGINLNAPKQAWWYLGGRQLGSTGNNGDDDPGYATAMAERAQIPGSGVYRNGATYGTTFSDFDQAYNSLSPGEGGGPGATYIARGGDTLASVAQAVYGDSSLWYLIADANGLTGNAQLAAGQQIRVPSKLANVHNTSDTFRPYDAARSIGDLTPSTPKPPANKKKGGCGILGVILLAIVAVVVAIYAPEALHAVAHAIGGALGTSVGVSTALAGAVIGAGVSVVTQGIAVATGLQDKFSWKGVALGAIGGAIGQIGALGKLFQNVSSPFLKGALTAVVQNAVTQGVGVATGLQDKFSWSGVAAAGLSGGVLGALGPSSSFAGQALRTGAAVLTRAAARSVIDGTDFGDNVVNELPDAIGQLVAQRFEAAQSAKQGAAQHGTSSGGSAPEGAGDANDIVVTARWTPPPILLPDPFPGLRAQLDQVGDYLATARFADQTNAAVNQASGADQNDGSEIVVTARKRASTASNGSVSVRANRSAATGGTSAGPNIHDVNPITGTPITLTSGGTKPYVNYVADGLSGDVNDVGSLEVWLKSLPSGVAIDEITRNLLSVQEFSHDSLNPGLKYDNAVVGYKLSVLSAQAQAVLDRFPDADLSNIAALRDALREKSIDFDPSYALNPADASYENFSFKSTNYTNLNSMIWARLDANAAGPQIRSLSQADIEAMQLHELDQQVYGGYVDGLGMTQQQIMYMNARSNGATLEQARNAALMGQLADGVVGLAGSGAAITSARVSIQGIGATPQPVPVATGSLKSANPEGIVYLRTDITGKLAPYGGQSINADRYLARQIEHARAFPESEFRFTIVDRANPGSALDIAEHNFIQELTGGIAARRSSAVSNLRDPVGAARRPEFGLPEPR